MDSDMAQQLSDEFASALSKILPDLTQLLQSNQILTTLEIDLEPFLLQMLSQATCTCCFVNGVMKCGPNYTPLAPGVTNNTGGLDPQRAQQLCDNVASNLFTVLPGLSQSVKQAGGSFEVHFFIDPTKADDEQPVVCTWVSDAQGSILQCSSS